MLRLLNNIIMVPDIIGIRILSSTGKGISSAIMAETAPPALTQTYIPGKQTETIKQTTKPARVPSIVLSQIRILPN